MIVKRLEFGNVIVDLGRTEAIIQKSELIPREIIKAGDRIKAYCFDVRREQEDNKFFYLEHIQNLWRSFSFKRFLRYTMV